MVRKMMTKEVTKTIVKLAIMELVDGRPVARELEDETILGNVSQESAQKTLNKKHGQPVTVFGVEADTTTYEMPVETFLQYATVKEPATEELPDQE